MAAGAGPAAVQAALEKALPPGIAARRYFLTGERFGADEAFRLGLVRWVVKGKQALAQTSERMGGDILHCAPAAIAGTQRLVDCCMSTCHTP